MVAAHERSYARRARQARLALPRPVPGALFPGGGGAISISCGPSPVRRHPRLNQRVTDRRDPTLARRQIVLTGPRESVSPSIPSRTDGFWLMQAEISAGLLGSEYRMSAVESEHDLLQRGPPNRRQRGRRRFRHAPGPRHSGQALYPPVIPAGPVYPTATNAPEHSGSSAISRRRFIVRLSVTWCAAAYSSF